MARQSWVLPLVTNMHWGSVSVSTVWGLMAPLWARNLAQGKTLAHRSMVVASRILTSGCPSRRGASPRPPGPRAGGRSAQRQPGAFHWPRPGWSGAPGCGPGDRACGPGGSGRPPGPGGWSGWPVGHKAWPPAGSSKRISGVWAPARHGCPPGGQKHVPGFVVAIDS